MLHESDPQKPIFIPTGGEGHFANSLDANEVGAGLGKRIDVVGGDMSPQPVEVHGLKEKLEAPFDEPLSDFDLSQRRSEQRRERGTKNRRIKGAALGLASAVALGISAPVIKEAPAIGSKVLGGVETIASAIGSALPSLDQTTDPEQLRTQRNVETIARHNNSQEAAIAAGTSGTFEPPVLELPPQNPQP